MNVQIQIRYKHKLNVIIGSLSPSLSFCPGKKIYLYRAPICDGYHELYSWRKICHMEKFQIFVRNFNNLWSFIKIYAIFVPNLCGEKSVCTKFVWRKNDKYEVCTFTNMQIYAKTEKHMKVLFCSEGVTLSYCTI